SDVCSSDLSRAKSAERMEGAITGVCMASVPWEAAMAPSGLAALPAQGLDAVVGGVDLARLALGLGAQLGGGAGEPVGVVLRHQPAVGLVHLCVGGVAGHAQRPVGGRVQPAADPAGVEGMADLQAEEPAVWVAEWQRDGD